MPTLSLPDILTLLSEYTLRQQAVRIDNLQLYTHITLDSRSATGTSIFVALCGMQIDARRFIPSCNASIILVDQWSSDWDVKATEWNKTIIQVPDARKDMAVLASALSGHPASKMTMVGITGTNGKTTTTWMLSHILRQCGQMRSTTYNVGTIGTIGPHLNGVALPDPDGFTTPESPGLQRLLQQFVEANCDVCIMEVSSIGLMMQRVGNILFDVAAFTNFTQDHLDIHSSMDEYLQEKQKLFTDHVHNDSLSVMVVDHTDISKTSVAKGNTCRVSTHLDPTCDGWIENPIFEIDGSRFTLHLYEQKQAIYIPLIGQHNIENALVATAIAATLGEDLEHIAMAFSSLPQAPGRMERISSTKGWHAFVDYAHTPDALEQSLRSLKELCTGNLWVLFGCGGDRDRQKRPQMGAIAYQYSDGIWITSDNPRSEAPSDILDEIQTGIPSECQKPVHLVVDRREAIHAAARKLRPNDVLLIAGKGHETYQIIDGTKSHFDDREEIRKHC